MFETGQVSVISYRDALCQIGVASGTSLYVPPSHQEVPEPASLLLTDGHACEAVKALLLANEFLCGASNGTEDQVSGRLTSRGVVVRGPSGLARADSGWREQARAGETDELCDHLSKPDHWSHQSCLKPSCRGLRPGCRGSATDEGVAFE